MRRTVTVESLSQTPSVRQGRGRPGLYVVHAGVRVCPLACVYFWFHAAPLCEVVGIFLCPCLKQVAPAWLALSRRSHGVTPGTDFCRRALHLGTPRGLRSTARSGGCASAILNPPAWEGWSLKVPCASREPGPGTGPQAHSALALPGKSFLIFPACHFRKPPTPQPSTPPSPTPRASNLFSVQADFRLRGRKVSQSGLGPLRSNASPRFVTWNKWLSQSHRPLTRR